MKVTYFVNTDGGCDYYRAKLPIETARLNKACQAEAIWPQRIIADVQFKPERFNQYMQSDIYVIQRIIGKPFIKRVQEYVRERNPKGKIVVEFDDNPFAVSPFSPHYADYGTEEAEIKLKGETLFKWKHQDGGEFDIKRNQTRMDEIIWSVEGADMVTVTTDILADVFRPINPNVRVLPNCVDTKIWRKLPFKNEKIRLFWAGGWSHYEDWLMLQDVLPKIMEKYPQVQLVVMGYLFPFIKKLIPADRIEFHDWVDTVAYPYAVANLNPDISVIPLRDTTFNRCKSAIKWIEMGALGVPSVASHVSPYAQMADLKENNGVFIEGNDNRAWTEGISALIEDEKLRREIGENARQTVLDNFDINTQFHQWMNAYQECMAWQPRPIQLSMA